MTTALLTNGEGKEDVSDREGRRSSPTERLLEPLQVNAKDVDAVEECSLVATTGIATTEDASRKVNDDNTNPPRALTAAPNKTSMAFTSKFDVRYDPLPFQNLVATAAVVVTQQQPQPAEERATLRRKEDGVERRQLSNEQPHNLYYDTFHRHQQFQPTTQAAQQRYRDAVSDRAMRWQSQLELTNNNDPRKRRIVDSNTNADGATMIEPAQAPMRVNIANFNGSKAETKRHFFPSHYNRKNDDSNPIPLQHPHFHPVQPLRTDRQMNNELGRYSELHVSKHIQGTQLRPSNTAHSRRANDERRGGVVDTFQGRPFYPPQHVMPPQHPMPPNPNNFHPPEHQLPLVTVDKGPPPPPPRGTTPIPTSFGRERMAQPNPSQQGPKDDLVDFGKNIRPPQREEVNTKTRKRSWRRRSLTGRADPNSDDEGGTGSSVPASSSSSKPTGGTDTYIKRIHDMLEEAYRDGFDHIVSWQPHGRAFKIHSPREFCDQIMPRYFHTRKIAHFRRWLSAWGFVRHCEGADRDAFYHRYFVRGIVVALVSKLTRDAMFRSMEGWLAPGEVPNFYSGVVDLPGGVGKHRGSSGDARTTSITTANGDALGPHSKVLGTQPEAPRTGIVGGAVGVNKNEDDVNELGTTPVIGDEDPSVVLHENPKLLRGTLLEDVRGMLHDAIEKDFTHVVSWLPSGKAFKVHDSAAFQDSVCKKYFKTSKLTSFSDSLRTWGFCRLWDATGVEKDAYYHRLFQQNKPHLCRHYSRTQMHQSMKEFREEQKRQKEISWSLFPRHREEQQQQRGSQTIPNPKAPRHDNIDAEEDPIEESEVMDNVIEAVDGEEAEDLIPYLRVTNTNNNMINDRNNAIVGASISVKDDAGMDRSLRVGDYGIDPTYQILPPGTMDSADKKDSITITEIQAKFKTAQDRKATMSYDAMLSFERQTGVSYPMRIEMMLEDVEKNGMQHIVSWMSHGRAWKIHDEKAFESTILLRYFSARSMASFSRWLNHWGFLRFRAGKDRRCWYHRLFVRGVTDLLKDFTQPQLFSAMEKWRAPGKEPDFYCSGKGDELSELPPVPRRKKTKTGTNEDGDVGRKKPSSTHNKEASHKPQPEKDPKFLRGTFLEKLREMLDIVRDEGKADVVSWLEHGKAFKIHNLKVFKESILHRFFGVSKYRYFGDVLRSWGFVIFKKGRDKGAFFHKYFVQTEPRLSLHLSRSQMKASMGGWSKNGTVPDFYNDNGGSSSPRKEEGSQRDNTWSIPNPNTGKMTNHLRHHHIASALPLAAPPIGFD